MAYLEATFILDLNNLKPHYPLKLPNLVEVKQQITNAKCVLVCSLDFSLLVMNLITLSSLTVNLRVVLVSQTEGSEQLRSRGLEVVGWYHSHPTFPALPSLRDLHTQVDYLTFSGQRFVFNLVRYFRTNSSNGSPVKRLLLLA